MSAVIQITEEVLLTDLVAIDAKLNLVLSLVVHPIIFCSDKTLVQPRNGLEIAIAQVVTTKVVGL
ncbi:hypothetical protein DGG96_16115 [Legionella qingyii]|uniref:Uncharacterized protein n=1 Tax=Legionella qingyii TaxID=2184757 RepID=A0A317U0A9_9GAMM|nr:hypothetical protein DGG96_18480 [Legionella qingyii]PWY54534.1 hypothetical protein DGG96_16115 [Legionella qingyii]